LHPGGKNGRVIALRNPHSTRPYQHVLECLSGYLFLAQAQYEDKTIQAAYNFGPDDESCVTTGELETLFCQVWGYDAKWECRTENGPHGVNFLKLDNTKMHKNKIRIKNFGPITEGYTDSEDGFFEINKLTVLTGFQGSGKSTIAKLISTFLWLEKAFVRGDFLKEDITKDVFVNNYLAYHLLDSYLHNNSEIEFIGTVYSFHFFAEKDEFKINKIKGHNVYLKPKIAYIFSERNFYSVLPNPNKLAGLLNSFFTTLGDFDEAKKSFDKEIYKLPIAGYKYRYDSVSDKSYIFKEGSIDEVELFKAASGIQSSLPLALISGYFSSGIEKGCYGNSKAQAYSFDDLQKIKRIYNEQTAKLSSEIKSDEYFAAMNIQNPWAFNFFLSNSFIKKNEITRLNKELTKKETEILTALEYGLFATINSCFVNIVEEPEQNLYPASQRDIIYYLLKCLNEGKKKSNDERIDRSEYNKLILTTHSPYVLGTINNAIYAGNLTKVVGKDCINIVDERIQLSIEYVNAYKTENGKIINIISDELRQIDNNVIDDCSDIINAEYEKLEAIEFDVD